MRSAYGLKVPEIDPELTRVGPGAPCGELMRRAGRDGPRPARTPRPPGASRPCAHRIPVSGSRP